MTTIERVADQYRIIFDKAAKRMNKDIVITDEELREFGIEPQVSRTVSDEFNINIPCFAQCSRVESHSGSVNFFIIFRNDGGRRSVGSTPKHSPVAWLGP